MTRLRPGVRATAVRDGVHVRGWSGSFTVAGASAVPRLWQRLEDALRLGDPDALLAQAGPGARRVLTTLLDTLAEHGMLVSEEDTDDWFGAIAPHPGVAARTARGLTVTVRAPENDLLATAVCRSLSRFGIATARVPGPRGPVLLSTSDHAVAVGEGGGTAFVSEPGPPGRARADGRALTARLGLKRAEPAADPLISLVAGTAVQRLLAAATGLPDPASYGDDPRLLPGCAAVLIATANGAEYHPWQPRTQPTTLTEALRLVEALGDNKIGCLPESVPEALPQLPVALARCGDVLGSAVRTDLARIEAACAAAEHLLGVDTVGVNREHAEGRALRKAAAKLQGVVTIEATQEDAMRFVSLAATGRAQARLAGFDPRHLPVPSGALSTLDGVDVPWLKEIADREAQLRHNLDRLVGPQQFLTLGDIA
ncbi:hypothetical protein SAMN05421504_10880 [Amycolatopsis xylanica]|uniref:Uncharacterized protein n=1 Tax=Amycolatopsis xylanica TaxID=589385 RepID=A0A1H3P8L8_9PSEU|nr:hypothetical protein [Amycolatopsis xylanica]SDY97524.1 hypothetical protein SAMN05421504_10880 [Amycolatopsis xylanica]